jgi:glycerol-3-phosphate responsive antiterminator
MTVNDYLNVMLANDAVREQILKHLSKLQRILLEDTCHVVQQISDFDLDVIEVLNGCASRISTR